MQSRENGNEYNNDNNEDQDIDSDDDEEKKAVNLELLVKNFESQLEKLGIVNIPEDDVVKEAKIGEGGCGKVYKGKYGDKIVAIKKIKLIKNDENVFNQISNEINVICTAMNPDIPEFYGVSKSKKGQYRLVFEFIDGKCLKDIYTSLNDKEKLHILSGLCDILIDFHSKKLIHRDIKPGNIMIEKGNKVRLIDFGVSKIAQHTSTYTKNQTGTVLYMAPDFYQIDLEKYSDPEQTDARPVPISTKCDVWALGVMTSEIFSHVKPYSNLKKPPNEIALITRLSSKLGFPIPDNLDTDVKEFVEKATAVDPDQRFSSKQCKEMLDEILVKRNEKEEKEKNK